MFTELIEEAYEELDEADDYLIEFFLDTIELEDAPLLAEVLGEPLDEVTELVEQMVKRVNSAGKIRKTLSRKIRARRASMTTGISKSRLKLRARKATRTKKRNPMVQRKALRKRRKALRKRKQFGL